MSMILMGVQETIQMGSGIEDMVGADSEVEEVEAMVEADPTVADGELLYSIIMPSARYLSVRLDCFQMYRFCQNPVRSFIAPQT